MRQPCCTTRDARVVPYPTMVTPSFPESSPGNERTIEVVPPKEWGQSVAPGVRHDRIDFVATNWKSSSPRLRALPPRFPVDDDF
jgi:hypothetical protein